MKPELETLAHEYFGGTLDVDGQKRLAEALRNDPAALSEFVDQMQIHQRLKVVETDADPVTAAVLRQLEYQDDAPRFSRDVVDRVKRARPLPRVSWLVWGAVAAFLLVVGLVLVVPGDSPLGGPHVLAAARAALERQGRSMPADKGMSILPGDVLDVPGFLALRLPQATRVELSGARVVVSGTGLELRQGRLDGTGALSLATPHGRVEGSAAWVTVKVSTSSTDIELEEGRLTLSRGGERLELNGGQGARMGADLAAVPLRREALLVVGEIPPGPGDALVRGRLERLRYAVTMKRARDVVAADAAGTSLVAISPTSLAKDVVELAGELRSTFRDSAIPVLTWEPRLLYDLGLIAGRENKVDWAATKGHLSLTMVESAHPLAAGLSGTVRVARAPEQFSWGRAREDAIRIAEVEGGPGRAAVFAYERGAAMPGLVAPARRVGFFLFEETAAALTDEGWALFDAAVRWCAAP